MGIGLDVLIEKFVGAGIGCEADLHEGLEADCAARPENQTADCTLTLCFCLCIQLTGLPGLTLCICLCMNAAHVGSFTWPLRLCLCPPFRPDDKPNLTLCTHPYMHAVDRPTWPSRAPLPVPTPLHAPSAAHQRRGGSCPRPSQATFLPHGELPASKQLWWERAS